MLVQENNNEHEIQITLTLTPDEVEFVSETVNALMDKCISAGWNDKHLKEDSLYWTILGILQREGKEGVNKFVSCCVVEKPTQFIRGYA